MTLNNDNKKSKKRTANECLGISISFACLDIYAVFAEETGGRHGGFTLAEDPYLYWGYIVIFGAISFCFLVCFFERYGE